MVRRPAILATGLVLAACGSSAALTTSSVSRSSAGCGPAGAHTLASDKLARIYSSHGAVFGCSVATGRVARLGRAGPSCLGGGRIGPVALAGAVAAYGVQICGIDTGTSSVIVRRLTDGRRLSDRAAMTRPLGAESYRSVGSIVVQTDGDVAWIAVGSSIIRQAKAIEVHALDQDGGRTLDSGGAVVADSLRLHGSTLTWMHGAKVRSAKLK
jgi:hypothetical protein